MKLSIDLTAVRAFATHLRAEHRPETADILETLADECERGRRLEQHARDMLGTHRFADGLFRLQEELRK
jgi:hypothetical protein